MNCTQLYSDFPSAVAMGRGKVTAALSSRKPVEPVSTKTWSIVWQVSVPGMHRRTLV